MYYFIPILYISMKPNSLVNPPQLVSDGEIRSAFFSKKSL